MYVCMYVCMLAIGAPTNLDGDYHQPPDSGLGSSDRRGGRRDGGQRSSSGLDGRRGRGREVDELSLSSVTFKLLGGF